MTEQEWFENKERDLINDIISISTIMDDYWRFHPDNPKKIDLVSEYKSLEELRAKTENELEKHQLEIKKRNK
tara:strand:- start:1530 stop:1745 length:216 start_codon:yes stop_codon:yes gene_type:complete